MVHEDIDAGTAATRDAVMMSPQDARRLGLTSGDRVRLRNDFGAYDGKVLLVPVTTGTLEVHWPEGNVLVDPKARSPLAKIPSRLQGNFGGTRTDQWGRGARTVFKAVN